MVIPKQIKIGGKVYAVEITNKLELGSVNCSAEINYTDLIIRVCPNAQQKMESDFIHEVLHGLAADMGYNDHDEEKIERLACALHALIVDNPGLFDGRDEDA